MFSEIGLRPPIYSGDLCFHSSFVIFCQYFPANVSLQLNKTKSEIFVSIRTTISGKNLDDFSHNLSSCEDICYKFPLNLYRPQDILCARRKLSFESLRRGCYPHRFIWNIFKRRKFQTQLLAPSVWIIFKSRKCFLCLRDVLLYAKRWRHGRSFYFLAFRTISGESNSVKRTVRCNEYLI